MMKLNKLLTASCLATALIAAAAVAQEQPVEVRVRAIAGPDGKLEVVEERVVGAEKSAEKKEAEATDNRASDKDDKDVDQPLRARLFRRVQDLGEKVGGAPTAEGGLVVVPEEAWGEMPQSDFWIGVQIAPVAPEIRKHMAVKHGVLVVRVYPDSPAVKAELKADDILLQAGDKKIETGTDLVKAVDAAKETELTFLVLRDGKEQKLTITPTKREDTTDRLTVTRSTTPRLEKLQAAQKQFEKALEALRAETQPDGSVDLMLVRPGAFMAYGVQPKMPDDLTVQITKEGNKPAKVEVKQGDKSWNTTGDKLDALPADIRPHVEHILNSGSADMLRTYGPGFPHVWNMKVAPHAAASATIAPYTTRLPTVTAVPPVAAVPAIPGVVPAGPPTVARAATAWANAIPHSGNDAKLDQILKKLDAIASPDLDEMKKELKALRKEVDELRKKSVDR